MLGPVLGKAEGMNGDYDQMRSDNKPPTPQDSTKPVSWQDHYVVITGPTASGKSALALAIAEMADGVVINADSMQLYGDLHLVTARPDAGDEARVPHRLYGVLDGSERASVGMWLGLAATQMAAARSAGKLPIITGGTGMYINGGLAGIAPIPDVPADIHAECVNRHHAVGGAAFRAELARLDPPLAARLFDGDSQRLVRAMGVVLATGRPLSGWQQEPHKGQLPGVPLCLAVMPPREILYERINKRFDWMLDHGALDEVAALTKRHLDPALPVMKALGVRELSAYLAGDLTLDRAIELAKRDSRRYAKRQMTWIRNNFNPNLMVNEKLSESLCEKIFSHLINLG